MDKICVICGARFPAPPSAKKVTCGQRPCVRANKVRTHRGVANTWHAAARQRVAQRGQTANLRQGTPAAQQSPLAGPFVTNQEAKDWWVTSPAGDTYTIRNLRAWCREHPDLFAPDPWPNAYAGLRQVQAWLMGKTVRMVSQWKGWTLARPAVSPGADSPCEPEARPESKPVRAAPPSVRRA